MNKNKGLSALKGLNKWVQRAVNEPEPEVIVTLMDYIGKQVTQKEEEISVLKGFQEKLIGLVSEA